MGLTAACRRCAETTFARQTLIQKNGEIYVFLTNEEQEINKAIDGFFVDPSDVMGTAAELVLTVFIRKEVPICRFQWQVPIRLQSNDGRPSYKVNQNYDITLRILTPDSDDAADEATLRMISGQSRCVLVVLPNDGSFIDELRSAIKIEKYLKSESSNSAAQFEQIKAAKRIEARDRREAAQLFLAESLKNADIYVNGDRIQSILKKLQAASTMRLENLSQASITSSPILIPLWARMIFAGC